MLPRTEKQANRYSNLDSDPRGAWTSSDLSVKTYSAVYDYPITTPSGRVVNPSKGRCWAMPKERVEELIADKQILQIATKPNDLVLDSFAGSGTTGHAAMQLNQADGGERRFILVEMETEICRSITAERLRRVIEGYTLEDQRGNQQYEFGLMPESTDGQTPFLGCANGAFRQFVGRDTCRNSMSRRW